MKKPKNIKNKTKKNRGVVISTS